MSAFILNEIWGAFIYNTSFNIYIIPGTATVPVYCQGHVSRARAGLPHINILRR